MSADFTLPSHFGSADDGTPEGLAQAIHESLSVMRQPNPVPEANRCAGMMIADPVIADQVEKYAKANGGKVSTFYGFKFITLADPERVLWKLKLIGRLEHQRRRIEAATDGLALGEARRRF